MAGPGWPRPRRADRPDRSRFARDDDRLERSRRVPCTGMAPFSKVAPVGRLVEGEVGGLDGQEGHGDDALDRRLGDLAGRRVGGADLERVLAAAQVDRRSSSRRSESAFVRSVWSAVLIVIDAAGDRRALEDVRGRVLVDLGHGRGRRGDGDGRRLGEAQELDAEVGPEGQRPRPAAARRRRGPARRSGPGVARRSGAGRRPGAACGSFGGRHARGATGAGRRPDRGRGTGRSCAGSPWCRRRRGARGSRPARGRRGSAPGSWCRARPGTGRRPCARARRASRSGRLAAGVRRQAARRVGRSALGATERRTSSLVVNRPCSHRRRAPASRVAAVAPRHHGFGRTDRIPQSRRPARAGPSSAGQSPSSSTSSWVRNQFSGP